LAEKEASEEVDLAVKALEAADSTEDSAEVASEEKVSVATAALEDLTGVDLVVRAANLALILDVSLEDFWVDFNCFVIEKFLIETKIKKVQILCAVFFLLLLEINKG
jgi:hypothetical protein